MKYFALILLLAVLPSPALAKLRFTNYLPEFQLTPVEQDSVSFDYTTCCLK